ncbi:MAG: molecular chaperone DnaJ [Actinobacteria bacterium]|nr:molecular chaperone DnaJ [Actinomycetota bacterium]
MAPQREWLDKDYYAVLGVPKDASADDIKKAYRKLARANHPDSKPDDPAAEQRFKEVGEAYAILGDEEKRREYDEIRKLAATGGGFGGGGFGGAGFEDGDLGDVLRTIFGQAGGGRGGSPFGGGFGGGRAARPRKGRDLTADVHLSFQDALAGVKTKLRISGDGPCGTCNGVGAAPGTAPHTCATCGGAGQVTVDQGMFSIANTCPACGGRGQVIDTPCPTCAGTGRVTKPRDLTVRLPAGVKDGATIRVAGRGGPGANGGPAGDVLVKVHVEPDRIFGRRGDDVTVDVPVTYAEAALGTKLKVPTPDGETTMIRIPSGTASGRTFRVRGKGAPRGNGRAGDLLVTVRVRVPQKLSRDQKKLIEQLAQLEDTSDRDALLFDRVS